MLPDNRHQPGQLPEEELPQAVVTRAHNEEELREDLWQVRHAGESHGAEDEHEGGDDQEMEGC